MSGHNYNCIRIIRFWRSVPSLATYLSPDQIPQQVYFSHYISSSAFLGAGLRCSFHNIFPQTHSQMQGKIKVRLGFQVHSLAACILSRLHGQKYGQGWGFDYIPRFILSRVYPWQGVFFTAYFLKCIPRCRVRIKVRVRISITFLGASLAGCILSSGYL